MSSEPEDVVYPEVDDILAANGAIFNCTVGEARNQLLHPGVGAIESILDRLRHCAHYEPDEAGVMADRAVGQRFRTFSGSRLYGDQMSGGAPCPRPGSER